MTTPVPALGPDLAAPAARAVTPTMRQIVAEVAAGFGLSPQALRGPGVARRVAWPRMYAMARCRAETPNSSTAVGRFFGGRDHTTVLHATTQFRDPQFVARFQGWAESLA